MSIPTNQVALLLRELWPAPFVEDGLRTELWIVALSCVVNGTACVVHQDVIAALPLWQPWERSRIRA